MKLFPPEMPRPAITRDSAGFWDACRRHELVIQRCAVCGTFRHPPEPCCPSCRSFAFTWQPVSGRGRIFSFAVVHRPFLPALEQHVPYAVIVVTLDDAPGVRIVSNLVGTAPEEARIDLEVEIVWDDVGADLALPRFRPVAAAQGRAGKG
jgi:uncharacterized OB-fold protein